MIFQCHFQRQIFIVTIAICNPWTASKSERATKIIVTLLFNDGFQKRKNSVKGVQHPWALFLKTLYICLKNKVTLDKISYGSGQKYSKELKYHSSTSVETIVVKFNSDKCAKIYIFHVLSHKSITT